MKNSLGINIILIAITFIALSFNLLSCGGKNKINSISDTHFDSDGCPKDSIAFFIPQLPQQVKLYIETSGSMNGFFRANLPNKFKKTVWSVFSDLDEKSGEKVYPLSNGGTIDTPVSISDFKNLMNEGRFVSNSATHIPAMLKNIIKEIDENKEEVAILVSDMKYSPMGKSAAVMVDQYQEEIRNLATKHNFAVGYVCAVSEFIGKNGKVEEKNSPYYFVVIGKPENVAAQCSDITSKCLNTDSYVESHHLCMDYKTPQYSILEISNGYKHQEFPDNVILNYNPKYNDTCTFIVRINLNGYPIGLTQTSIDSCFNVTTTYGAGITKELIALEENKKTNGQSESNSYADFKIKVFGFQIKAGDVINLAFNSNEINKLYSDRFLDIINNGQSEDDLARTFSFNKFIEGHNEARPNKFSIDSKDSCKPQPIRILISQSV